jgi:hypothetical protein
MAKSYTKKLAKLHTRDMMQDRVHQVAHVVQAASDHVHRWTQREATRLLQRTPLIIPLGDGCRVGRYLVRPMQGHWLVYDAFDQALHGFSEQRSAVAWCVMTQLGKLVQSQKLLTQDQRMSKLQQDKLNYNFSRQRAILNQDLFMVDVLDARLQEIYSQWETARDELFKTLLQAKYIKDIWE